MSNVPAKAGAVWTAWAGIQPSISGIWTSNRAKLYGVFVEAASHIIFSSLAASGGCHLHVPYFKLVTYNAPISGIVINHKHVRLCFIAYWLCAKLADEWRVNAEKGEVQRLLRRLQAIRVGTLKIADQDSKRLLTQIPPELNTMLGQLGLLPLFSQLPAWAEA